MRQTLHVILLRQSQTNYMSISARRFYSTGGMTNIYSFIQRSLEWRFSELFYTEA